MLTCAGFLALGARGVWSAERAAPRLVPRCSRLLEEGPASRSDPLGLDMDPASARGLRIPLLSLSSLERLHVGPEILLEAGLDVVGAPDLAHQSLQLES